MDKATLEYGLQFKTDAERRMWLESLSGDERDVIVNKIRPALCSITEWWQTFQDACQVALLEIGK